MKLKPYSTESRLFRVQATKCVDLVVADSVFMGGKSDPYVVFKVGDVKFRSTQIWGDLNPVWNDEVHEFTLTEGAMYTKSLEILVYDADKLGDDELIGSVKLPLMRFEQKLPSGTEEEFDLEIPPEFQAQGHSSKIYLKFELLTEEMEKASKEQLLWENERLAKGKWDKANLTAGERKGWSVGARSGVDRAAMQPKIPKGMETKLGWSLDLDHGGEDGWYYAKSFDGPWVNKPNGSSEVRRRMWMQRCTAIVEDNGSNQDSHDAVLSA
ncbi:hypothetical protein H310_07643 [Aphanomyces invadans]|uniref:C2 domain-containing protein n=1 Tax=Aphanomyces invadans TaxID=157072 RepID=A0A024U1E8_9STRA|nr:hypothetical protein H310_07643 [Aphanomyces invadans]ETW00256.1 hypothetical protein H310_07643 [Aphanomyces invadans]|eukprot:XP_008871281.1 hypothetical protein H310_07643 [Aphanomyces invadans]